MRETEFLPRHELRVSFTRLLITVLAVATVGRPLVVALDPVFTALGLVNLALSLGVYWLLRSERLPRWEASLILGLCLVSVLPLMVISGGVNSQFAYLVPIFPPAASMLSGNRLAMLSCALWLVLIAVLAWAGPEVSDLTGELYHHEKSISRAIWLALGVVIATGFGVYFQNAHNELARQLHEQATFDHLTRVVNRRALEAVINREVKRVERTRSWLSLLMVDVDYFKQFNDRHGHTAGDRALVAIASCLRHHTREGQDLVGRYGGEEFVVVLTDTEPEGAGAVAEKLRHAVAELRVGPDEHLSVTIGVASTRGSAGMDRHELIRRADEALYAGKSAGRDRVIHFTEGAPRAELAAT